MRVKNSMSCVPSTTTRTRTGWGSWTIRSGNSCMCCEVKANSPVSVGWVDVGHSGGIRRSAVPKKPSPALLLETDWRPYTGSR